MITLKNSEISSLGSPTINSLFADTSRRFPAADAFIFANLMAQIQQKLAIYREQARKTIEAYGGKVNEDGSIECAASADKIKITQELQKLNEVEVEIVGNRVEWKESWPALSVQEAYILKPLIN